MKKFLAIITGLVSILAMTSCSNMSEQDIEKEIASGVVLVQNQSYYEVDLSNGAKIFFSNFDEKEGINGLATDEDSVEVSTSYGTGFSFRKMARLSPMLMLFPTPSKTRT